MRKKTKREREINHNVRGFINTNDIFSHLVTQMEEIEKLEIDTTENHSDKVRTDSKNKKGRRRIPKRTRD